MFETSGTCTIRRPICRDRRCRGPCRGICRKTVPLSLPLQVELIRTATGTTRQVGDQRVALEHEALLVLAGLEAVGDAVDVVHAVEGEAGAAHADEAARAQDLAVATTSSVPSPVTTSAFSTASAMPSISACAGERLAVSLSGSIFCGIGTTSPSGGLNGVTGGIGIGRVTPGSRVLDVDDRQHRALRLVAKARGSRRWSRHPC